MRITILGAAGKVGQRVTSEALSRHHQVTAVVRKKADLGRLPASAIAASGDASNLQDVIRLSLGQDLVINATRPAPYDREAIFTLNQTLLEGLANTGTRLLIAGGAASLAVPGSGGVLVIDDPRYLDPAARPVAQASLDQYRLCQQESRVDWTYLSPPAQLVAGLRTGTFRLGHDELLVDDRGRSVISMEDLAVALLDEAEHPRHRRSRFTVAY